MKVSRISADILTDGHTMRIRSGILIAVAILLAYAQPAYAYLDPGSGGMIVQLLLGGAAGAAVLVKLFWHRLIKVIGLRKGDQGE
jgi:hypothetical protein